MTAPAADAVFGEFGARCRSCRQLVLWATTEQGERLPVNPTSDPHGNVVLAVQRGQLVAGVLDRKQAARTRMTGAVRLYKSHFATCPYAGAHRRR